jgi:hypothetical protein
MSANVVELLVSTSCLVLFSLLPFYQASRRGGTSTDAPGQNWRGRHWPDQRRSRGERRVTVDSRRPRASCRSGAFTSW